jgi:FtsP/CotA-like multicopper oxidase with cupredoxin domain
MDEPVRVGDLQVWKIVNETGMDHPFHLHGFFFQVLRARDVPADAGHGTMDAGDRMIDAPYWKDTVNVPARDSVTIAWRPDDRPGGWMYHCHILEHHAVGMMGHFDVVRAAGAE